MSVCVCVCVCVCTCVHPSSEYPRPGGDSCFDQPFAHHLFDPRVQIKVLDSSVDRDEDLGQLHLPLFHHQPQDALRPRVIGQPHILHAHTWQNSEVRKQAKSILLLT